MHYVNFSKFIIRIPLLPISELNSFLSINDNLGNKIKNTINNYAVKEAIFLATPDLYSKFQP